VYSHICLLIYTHIYNCHICTYATYLCIFICTFSHIYARHICHIYDCPICVLATYQSHIWLSYIFIYHVSLRLCTVTYVYLFTATYVYLSTVTYFYLSTASHIYDLHISIYTTYPRSHVCIKIEQKKKSISEQCTAGQVCANSCVYRSLHVIATNAYSYVSEVKTQIHIQIEQCNAGLVCVKMCVSTAFCTWYGVATIIRLLEIIGIFCRALSLI